MGGVEISIEISQDKINLRTEITPGGRNNRHVIRIIISKVPITLGEGRPENLQRRKGANDSGGEFKALELWHPSSDLCLHIVCFFSNFYGRKMISPQIVQKIWWWFTRHLKKSGCLKIVLRTMCSKSSRSPAESNAEAEEKRPSSPGAFGVWFTVKKMCYFDQLLRGKAGG